MKPILLILYFIIHFCTSIVSAIELETRMPPSIWKIELDFKYTPTYSKAFNGYGEKAPLHELILWNMERKEDVEGEIKREENMNKIHRALSLLII